MTSNHPRESASLSRIQARHWLLLAVSLAGSVVAGKPHAGGVLLGGGAIGFSVLVYAIGLRAMVRRTSPRLAIGLLFVKLLAFLGLGWLVFVARRDWHPDPVGVALGLTCFPVAAVWEALRVQGRH